MSAVCRMSDAIITALGGKSRDVVHVDLKAKLTEKGLTKFHSENCWPPAAAVRELATKVAALKRKGVKKPYGRKLVDSGKYLGRLCLGRCHLLLIRQIPT